MVSIDRTAQPMNRILIFETDPQEAIHLSQFLQNSGYAVATVTTARQAVSFAREYEFELFLVNLSSPRETGFTTVAEIKCRPQTAHVPVVAMVPQMPMKESALSAGCDAVLVKPFDSNQVLKTITELLERADKSITYMQPMEAPDAQEETFESISKTICKDVAWLEERMPELGEQGPIAIESMRDAASDLLRRLEPEKITPGQSIPDSVRNRQVRHDFRNLLAAVNGFAEILLLEDSIAEDLQEKLRVLKKESRQFCNLLDAITDTAA